MDRQLRRACLDTPLGRLAVESRAGGITALRWVDRDRAAPEPGEPDEVLQEACRKLDDYFGRRSRTFRLPLAPAGTRFQQRAWQALQAIPYGRTVTYGRLASELDSGPRAIAAACAANPLPIIIPCHRVVAAGSDGGFSAPGGLATKRYLLGLEGRPTQTSLLGDLDDPE
jgi:methylated-DNA-[protein]-cysteine S-methyltransferase